MVTGMMERDPEQRLTAQQALATPWIAGEGLGRTADIGANVIAPLREWQSVRGFDKAVIGVVAGILESQEGAELDEIRAAFETVDADGSGQLNPNEFRTAIENLNLSLSGAEVGALFDSVDLDHSGKIDIHEFMSAALSKQQYLQRDRLQAAFAQIDLDSSGAIDAAELGALLGEGQDVTDVLAEIGKGVDDEITYAEFEALMMGKE